MVFKIKGTVELSFAGVEIEAKTEEEARAKFFDTYNGEVKDLLGDAETIIEDDLNIDKDGIKIEEATYLVKVTDIDYDVSEGDLGLSANDDLSDEAIDEKIKALKETLPQELTVEVTCNPDEIEDYIADEILDITNFGVNSVKDYKILEIK